MQFCKITRLEDSKLEKKITGKIGYIGHGSLALDSAVVRKNSKRHFFQDIKNSLHGVTRMGLKPHQNFFQNFFSTSMVPRGVQSFCILEGATDSHTFVRIGLFLTNVGGQLPEFFRWQ